MKRLLATIVLVSVVACGTVESTQTRQGSYELRYRVSDVADSLAVADGKLEAKAHEHCPDGWIADKKSAFLDGQRVVVWEVDCRSK